ncbi:MAG: TRAP transporter substrate-binding protein [Hyphomicrobiaceae bacterium]|nr:TRAP transporter substrate-binding protein [Hyphomicrobiaceae bacterium]
MDRRSFLKKAGVVTAGAAATSALATPALSQDRRELKMVTTWPKNFPGLGTGAQRVADRITAMTDGRITVTLYAAGELVGAFESFDAVSTGAADMYHGAEYYWQGKHKGFNFFTAVPLGMTAGELDGWVNHAGGQALWDELAAGFNLKPMMAGNTGVQMGGWFAREINSLEDMRGIKMRMPGLGGEVLRRLGASAVALPGGEIFPALQSGAIDATEWVGPWNDRAFGFQRIVKNYYYPGFHEPGSGLAVGMNLDVFNSLADSDKELVKAACLAENNVMYSEYMANNGAALSALINEDGVTLRKFPDEVWAEFARLSEEVVNEAAEDDIGRRILASYQQARKDMAGWTKIAEQTYAEARGANLDI